LGRCANSGPCAAFVSPRRSVCFTLLFRPLVWKCVLLKVSGCVSYSFSVHMTIQLLPLFMCGLFSQDVQVVPRVGGVSFKRDCGDGLCGPVHACSRFVGAIAVSYTGHFVLLQWSGICGRSCSAFSSWREMLGYTGAHGFTYYAQDIFLWLA